MGLIGGFFRLIFSVIIFFVVLGLGIFFAPQLSSFFHALPGTFDVQFNGGTVEIPILASIVASVGASVLISLITLPFRARANRAE